MSMETIAQYLPKHPFFAGLDEETVSLLAGCAINVHLRPGEYLFHEGESADRFYVVRHGRVTIELRAPVGGGAVLDTAQEGDVIGWSWLIPPYRWMFDARATDETSAVSLDAACLRGKCEADPAVGFAVLKRVAATMAERLQSARVRLLDLYGEVHA
jgi:CRP/FNR family transcriptional regulator, cyclic AMP receptor protein